jgi:hypothetical protein
MDPFSRLKILVQQGALLCELSKLDAIFRSKSAEEIIKIKEQVCHYPYTTVGLPTDSISSNLEDENLSRFLNNCKDHYTLPPIDELRFPSTTTMLDIIEMLENWVNKLSLLLPIYPVIKGFDSASESSDSSSSRSSRVGAGKSTESLVHSPAKHRVKLNTNVLDELMKTEKSYIESLVRMHEYQIECNHIGLSLTKDHPDVPILRIRQLWFPEVNALREFHVHFFVNVQIFRSMQKSRPNIERFTSLFGAFHEALPIYNEWIDTSAAVGSEIIQHNEVHANQFPQLDELIPLDKSIAGMASLRIQPMQRLLRYPLLLKEMMRDVQDESTKLHLEVAHLVMTGIAHSINEHRAKQEKLFIKERYLNRLSANDWKRQMQSQEFLADGKAVIRTMEDNGKSMKELACTLLLFENGIYVLEEKKKPKHNSVGDPVFAGAEQNEQPPTRPKMHFKRTMTSLRRAYKSAGPHPIPGLAPSWTPAGSIPFHRLQEVYRLTPLTMRCVMQGDWQDIEFESKEVMSIFYSECRKALTKTQDYQTGILDTIQNCKVHFVGANSRKVNDIVWTAVHSLTKSGETIPYEAFVKQLCTQIGTLHQWTSIKLWYLDEDEDRVRLQTDEDLEMALGMKVDILWIYVT